MKNLFIRRPNYPTAFEKKRQASYRMLLWKSNNENYVEV